MSILLGKNSRVIVQGITGREGRFHTQQMLAYGTPILGGVTPGKGGQWVLGLPVFDTMHDAVESTGATVAGVFVTAPYAADAIMEAVDAGIDLVVCITEGVPVLDMARVYQHVQNTATRLIGPNSPGIITPGEAKLGVMPSHIFRPGSVGIISRSGSLTYEMVHALSSLGVGQSTVVGIGGDPLLGSNFIDVLNLFDHDPKTKHIIIIGEIGGDEEQRAANFIRHYMRTPVTAFIAGLTAPPNRRMGHAGAIIEGGEGSAAEKVSALERVGVTVGDSPLEVALLVRDALANAR
jgi:succinyl-CoA synthetase alpha subunit